MMAVKGSIWVIRIRHQFYIKDQKQLRAYVFIYNILYTAIW